MNRTEKAISKGDFVNLTAGITDLSSTAPQPWNRDLVDPAAIDLGGEMLLTDHRIRTEEKF